MKNKTTLITLGIVGLIMLAATGQQFIEYLKIGGGYGNAGTTLEADGDILTDGSIAISEKADHSVTPGAGFGVLWTKNTAPSTLIYTDDAGTDTTLGAGSGDALVGDPLSQFAATTSAQLAGVLSDETGTGAAVLATSPTLVTPILGTPTSGTLTNASGLPIIAGTTGTLTTARGGTGLTALGTANQVLATNAGATAMEWQTVGGTGTVTSVAVSGSDGIEIDSGSPITTTGTIALGVNAGTLRTTINVENGATADQTGAEIKSAYEGEANTNAYTDADETTVGYITVTGARDLDAMNTAIGLNTAKVTNATHSGDVTGATALTIATGAVTAAKIAAMTSAQLAGILSDETGTGAAVYATSPTLVTPSLGTPSALTLTNATGLPGATGITGDVPLANVAQIAEGTLAGRDKGAGTGDITALTPNEVQEIFQTPVSITSSSLSTAWNSDNGQNFAQTMTENTTVAASSGSNLFNGKMVIFQFAQAAGGYTLAWNASFVAEDGLTASIPAAAAASGTICIYGFMYHAGRAEWLLLAHTEIAA